MTVLDDIIKGISPCSGPYKDKAIAELSMLRTEIAERREDSKRLKFVPELLKLGFNYMYYSDGRWVFIPNENYKGDHPEIEFTGADFNKALDKAMEGIDDRSNEADE